jgi:hypothetical protein
MSFSDHFFFSASQSSPSYALTSESLTSESVAETVSTFPETIVPLLPSASAHSDSTVVLLQVTSAHDANLQARHQPHLSPPLKRWTNAESYNIDGLDELESCTDLFNLVSVTLLPKFVALTWEVTSLENGISVDVEITDYLLQYADFCLWCIFVVLDL